MTARRRRPAVAASVVPGLPAHLVDPVLADWIRPSDGAFPDNVLAARKRYVCAVAEATGLERREVCRLLGPTRGFKARAAT